MSLVSEIKKFRWFHFAENVQCLVCGDGIEEGTGLTCPDKSSTRRMAERSAPVRKSPGLRDSVWTHESRGHETCTFWGIGPLDLA